MADEEKISLKALNAFSSSRERMLARDATTVAENLRSPAPSSAVGCIAAFRHANNHWMQQGDLRLRMYDLDSLSLVLPQYGISNTRETSGPKKGACVDFSFPALVCRSGNCLICFGLLLGRSGRWVFCGYSSLVVGLRRYLQRH